MYFRPAERCIWVSALPVPEAWARFPCGGIRQRIHGDGREGGAPVFHTGRRTPFQPGNVLPTFCTGTGRRAIHPRCAGFATRALTQNDEVGFFAASCGRLYPLDGESG